MLNKKKKEKFRIISMDRNELVYAYQILLGPRNNMIVPIYPQVLAKAILDIKYRFHWMSD
jgi:hypothetical protein